MGERALRRRADLERVPARDPGGDDRLHRDRDRLEPRRGGAGSCALDSARHLVGRDRRLCDLLHAAVDRPLRDAGRARGHALRDAARPAAAARIQERSGARARREPRPARGRADDREDLRRHPRRDDPLHRHERRRDRRVADHVLDGELSPAAGGVPPAAPEAEDAVAVARRLRRDRAVALPALRAGRLPRPDVRVRGDALVHDRAPRGRDAACAAARRGARVARVAERHDPRRQLADLRDRRCDRHRQRLARRRRAGRADALRRAGVAGRRLRLLRPLPPTAAGPPGSHVARAGTARPRARARVSVDSRAARRG